MPRFTAEYLSSAVQAILEGVGTPVPIARQVTEALINANLTGHDSHGVIRLPDYLVQVDQEIISVDAEPKELHLVECCINKIKHYRRIFSRFEKLAQRYLGFLSFVSSLIWLR